jgi:hypothetical protein
MTTHTCQFCPTTFTPRTSQQVTCGSPACQRQRKLYLECLRYAALTREEKMRKWRGARKHPPVIPCVVCRTPFDRRGTTRLTCSPACRTERRRVRSTTPDAKAKFRAWLEANSGRVRNRYAEKVKNAAWAEKVRTRNREYRRKRRESDPDFAARAREACRRWQRRMYDTDPAYREQIKARNRDARREKAAAMATAAFMALATELEARNTHD